MISALINLSQKQKLRDFSSARDWFSVFHTLTKGKDPFEKALIGGFCSQQFSFAFLSGYQAALEAMFPGIADPDKLKALCVSEEGGNHPKAIETILVNNILSGQKTYITAGTEAEQLFVLCKTEEVHEGRPVLKMVLLSPTLEGIEISHFPLPILTEVEHGRMSLNDVRISTDQILPGDGSLNYTKPFRSREDIGVGTANQAMLLRQAIEYGWEAELRDQLLLSLYNLSQFHDMGPLDPQTHLFLTANERRFLDLLPSIEENIFAHSPEAFQQDWKTNNKVIAFAKKVKEIRLEKARKRLFG
ncbi:MAG: acyl-CoA dehydrogenase family protein [Bacteroidota bacterium]